jgi:Zn-dependent protease with chaperone function
VLAREPVAGLVALFLGLPTVLLNGAAIRSLVFSAPSPKGVPLTASTAPKLITMIEEVQQTIGCRALKGVLVVPACNASAYQAGSIWRPRNFLLIGYPLLLVLSPEQLKAVVAHELAHFANGDSRLAGLVYRIRVSWLRLAGVLNERGTVPIFVRCVFTRYLPRLEAGSAEVARAHEFFADQAAAAVSSPTTSSRMISPLSTLEPSSGHPLRQPRATSMSHPVPSRAFTVRNFFLPVPLQTLTYSMAASEQSFTLTTLIRH